MTVSVPPSTVMRFEVVTGGDVRGAAIVRDVDGGAVRRRADAGPWAIQYRCRSDRVGRLLEVLADEPGAVAGLALPLSSCALRIGNRAWPIAPFDEIAAGMWARVRVPAGGAVTIVNELLGSPVGSALVALRLTPVGPPALAELDPSVRPESLVGAVHWSAHTWVRRALWARGACTTGELVLASSPRPGADWRIYETLNGYYHADELDRSGLPPLPSALATWYDTARSDSRAAR